MLFGSDPVSRVNLTLRFPRWRDTILLFVKNSTVKGHCKFGNIHHPAVANGLISVSVSRDCPAFVLIPTNAAEYQTSASNCPLLGMATVEPITVPANMRVDVKTIQNGLRKLEDPLIATYT
ncbi:hypothetical protein QR680_014250 [Steinernema hermaphroditum]|uniref:Uncharacterized protein n=1 Tax=Steinernema hermaphroditum TaxID=289476 RepID=A0AA39M3W9_9BILA|nr:hypothetical protein QR680_014250 [Steinernema hermaphroditum]